MGIAGDFTLIVLAGLAGAVVARALRLPLLVGYVAAGVVVGPHTAGPTIANFEDIELLAEIGVALLLFALGLELSFRDLQAVRRVAVIGGPIQILLTAAIGALVTRAATGMAMTDAVWFGAMLSLSSTMVVLKTLAATGTTSTLASRVMIALLVIQDLAVVPLLIVLPQIGEIGADGSVMRVMRATLAAGLFLLVVVTVGARVLPALLRRVVRFGSREMFLIAVVAAGVGVGYLAFRMGLSFAVGAFVAGLILSDSEMSHQALSDIGPLRDLFGLLFFVSVGMLFDPRFALEHAGDVAAIVLVTIVGKSVICGVLARAFGYKNLAPWIVGLGMSQVGEFSFVLARVGQTGGFISDDTYNLALTCTVLSMATSPLVFPGLLPIARAWARSRRQPTSPTTTNVAPVALENHVIVAGYGRTGRAVVGALHGAGVPYVVVEHHHEALTELSEQGIPTIWGDISGEDILRAAGVTQARMIVMAVPEWRAVRLGIEHATRLNARLFVVARATTRAHVDDLRGLRVDAIVQPEFEGGVEMVRRALRQLDRQDEEINRLSRDLRRALYGDDGSDDRPGG